MAVQTLNRYFFMSNKTVIILNGPPGSGKDTIADFIAAEFNAEHLRFKTKLYAITALINNLDFDEFMKIATDQNTKDSVKLARGLTARQLIIETSENVIKPYYGKEYFGNDVGDSILKSDKSLFVLSDGGFPEELSSMIGVGCLNYSDVVIVKLYRTGCNFDNDSRTYFNEAILHPDIRVIPFINDLELYPMYDAIKQLVRSL